jgi:hypothetical protein
MIRTRSVPERSTMHMAAIALGDRANCLDTKTKAWELLADLFDDCPQGNRTDTSVICARLAMATLLLETLERGETDRHLLHDGYAAKRVLSAIRPIQGVVDRIEARCRRGIEAPQKESLEWSDSRL